MDTRMDGWVRLQALPYPCPTEDPIQSLNSIGFISYGPQNVSVSVKEIVFFLYLTTSTTSATNNCMFPLVFLLDHCNRSLVSLHHLFL